MSRILTSNSLFKMKTEFSKSAFHQTGKIPASSSSCSSKTSKAIKKTFDTPRPPKDPAENYNPSCVDHDAFDVPTFIPAAAFRSFTSKCEKLGPGASKCGCYKNPEYHSYHRYSFVTLQTECLKLRAQLRKQSSVGCRHNKKE